MSLRLQTLRSYQDNLGGSEAKNNSDSRDISILVRFCGEMQATIQIGRPYQTRLDLLGADPRVANPPRSLT